MPIEMFCGNGNKTSTNLQSCVRVLGACAMCSAVRCSAMQCSAMWCMRCMRKRRKHAKPLLFSLTGRHFALFSARNTSATRICIVIFIDSCVPSSGEQRRVKCSHQANAIIIGKNGTIRPKLLLSSCMQSAIGSRHSKMGCQLHKKKRLDWLRFGLVIRYAVHFRFDFIISCFCVYVAAFFCFVVKFC